MKKELIKLADHLDKRGLKKEADYLDAVIKRMTSKILKEAVDSSEIDDPGIREVIQQLEADIETLSKRLDLVQGIGY